MLVLKHIDISPPLPPPAQDIPQGKISTGKILERNLYEWHGLMILWRKGLGGGGQCYNTVNMSLRKVGMGSDNFK